MKLFGTFIPTSSQCSQVSFWALPILYVFLWFGCVWKSSRNPNLWQRWELSTVILQNPNFCNSHIIFSAPEGLIANKIAS